MTKKFTQAVNLLSVINSFTLTNIKAYLFDTTPSHNGTLKYVKYEVDVDGQVQRAVLFEGQPPSH